MFCLRFSTFSKKKQPSFISVNNRYCYFHMINFEKKDTAARMNTPDLLFYGEVSTNGQLLSSGLISFSFTPLKIKIIIQ